MFADYDYVDTWKGMEKCVELGLTKSIGLANFNSQQVERILKVAKIKPVMNQIECHPYLNQKKLIKFCNDRDILVTAYSPFGSASRPLSKSEEPFLLENENLKKIAARLGRTVAQVVLKYLVGFFYSPSSSSPRFLT